MTTSRSLGDVSGVLLHIISVAEGMTIPGPSLAAGSPRDFAPPKLDSTLWTAADGLEFTTANLAPELLLRVPTNKRCFRDGEELVSLGLLPSVKFVGSETPDLSDGTCSTTG
jgi:hypothetical protein